MTRNGVQNRARKVAGFAGAWILAGIMLAGAARAGDLASAVIKVVDEPIAINAGARGQDELWYASTRHLELSDLDPLSLPRLQVLRHSNGIWGESSIETLVGDSDPAKTTLFYFHGNRVPVEYAIEGGSLIYQQVRDAISWETPIRFVIWSWPSDRICGQLRDFRVKAVRTDVDALFLAGVLSRMPRQVPVSILAYSFGARIVTGGLHLTGGGELLGKKLGHENPGSIHPVRTVLFAGAVHQDWLYSGGKQSRACSQMNKLLVLYNSLDPLLMHYRYLEKHSRPAALGFAGLEQGRLADQSVVFHQRDVRDQVGLSHSESRYFASIELVRQLSRYLQWKKTQ